MPGVRDMLGRIMALGHLVRAGRRICTLCACAKRSKCGENLIRLSYTFEGGDPIGAPVPSKKSHRVAAARYSQTYIRTEKGGRAGSRSGNFESVIWAVAGRLSAHTKDNDDDNDNDNGGYITCIVHLNMEGSPLSKLRGI